MRLFCDICDVFDKHDTEDCPLQSSEEIGSKHHGERGVERPYCTTCESKKVYMVPAVYLMVPVLYGTGCLFEPF